MSKSDKKRVNSIITVSRFDNRLTFAFTGAGEFVFDPDKVSAENRARAMMHGFEQRIRDAAALSVDRDTGKSATPQEKYEAARRIADHLMSGATEWNIKAAPTRIDTGLILQAMMRALGRDLEACEALLATTVAKRDVDRDGAAKIWAESKQVARAILEIRAERLARDTDVDDLLAEMDEEAGGEGDEEEDDETDEA